MSAPRIAFFPDSDYDANGVARTATALETYAGGTRLANAHRSRRPDHASHRSRFDCAARASPFACDIVSSRA